MPPSTSVCAQAASGDYKAMLKAECAEFRAMVERKAELYQQYKKDAAELEMALLVANDELHKAQAALAAAQPAKQVAAQPAAAFAELRKPAEPAVAAAAEPAAPAAAEPAAATEQPLAASTDATPQEPTTPPSIDELRVQAKATAAEVLAAETAVREAEQDAGYKETAYEKAVRRYEGVVQKLVSALPLYKHAAANA